MKTNFVSHGYYIDILQSKHLLLTEYGTQQITYNIISLPRFRNKLNIMYPQHVEKKVSRIIRIVLTADVRHRHSIRFIRL